MPIILLLFPRCFAVLHNSAAELVARLYVRTHFGGQRSAKRHAVLRSKTVPKVVLRRWCNAVACAGQAGTCCYIDRDRRRFGAKVTQLTSYAFDETLAGDIRVRYLYRTNFCTVVSTWYIFIIYIIRLCNNNLRLIVTFQWCIHC